MAAIVYKFTQTNDRNAPHASLKQWKYRANVALLSIGVAFAISAASCAAHSPTEPRHISTSLYRSDAEVFQLANGPGSRPLVMTTRASSVVDSAW